MDFLTDRSQRARVNGVLSNVLLSSTSSPQGGVLSPLLFVSYTNACQSNNEGRHVIKFADDFDVIVSLLSNNDINHSPVVDDFSDWCEHSWIFMCPEQRIIDFRKKPPPIPSVFVHGQADKVVQQYKYLGTIINTI